jgi:protein-serine/threonine kinase
VERASAAKIYLEMYYLERLCKPQPREVCRRHMETNLLRSNMSPGQRNAIWKAFNVQWTWHLRESRVLKTKCARATRGDPGAPCLEDYETLKLLGKGSFGVVKLVCEKPKAENSFRRQLYAMKVIRKSDMIRNAQEGHLHAERDLLAAAEGSNW